MPQEHTIVHTTPSDFYEGKTAGAAEPLSFNNDASDGCVDDVRSDDGTSDASTDMDESRGAVTADEDYDRDEDHHKEDDSHPTTTPCCAGPTPCSSPVALSSPISPTVTTSTSGRWKKARGRMLIPKNIAAARASFLLPGPMHHANPLFTYHKSDPTAKLLSSKLRECRDNYLSFARDVLDRAAHAYGRGRVLLASDPPESDSACLDQEAIREYLKKYLSSNRLDGNCKIRLESNLPSAGIFINRPRATLARVRCEKGYFGGDDDCKHTLLVSKSLLSSRDSGKVTPTRLLTFAVHEIGTHLVRRSNEEIQPWLRQRDRYDMTQDIRVLKATEEGLAMVHEAMHLPSLLLARPALYYYASARAAALSFVELFEELEQWVEDEGKRFDICALVKRGVRDTSERTGGSYYANGEVQVYFEGAVEILQKASTLDPVLLFCGKLSLSDMALSRVQRVVRRDGIVLPEFAKNVKEYGRALERVARANGLLKKKKKKKTIDQGGAVKGTTGKVADREEVVVAVAGKLSDIVAEGKVQEGKMDKTERDHGKKAAEVTVVTPQLISPALSPLSSVLSRTISKRAMCEKKRLRSRTQRGVGEAIGRRSPARKAKEKKNQPQRKQKQHRTQEKQHPRALEKSRPSVQSSENKRSRTGEKSLLPPPPPDTMLPAIRPPKKTTSQQQWDVGKIGTMRCRWRVLCRSRLPRAPVMIRDAPDRAGHIVGSLFPGTVVVAYETKGKWIRISPKAEWMATEWTSPSVGDETLLEPL